MIIPGRSVKDVVIDSETSIEEIFKEMSQSGGFESVNLSNGFEILSDMIQDEKCLKFISFVGGLMLQLPHVVHLIMILQDIFLITKKDLLLWMIQSWLIRIFID